MVVRQLKVLLTAAVALFFTLVAIGNVTDYGSNYAFVQHVMSMDTTFRSPALMWRAIDDPRLYTVAYWLIIAWQIATALMCWAGAIRLFANRDAPLVFFSESKSTAILGVAMGLLLYVVGFITIAGEWFAMWQSTEWNGQEAAHIFILVLGITLLFLNQRDEELPLE
jgi:predicted small integral membrane protein